MKLVKLLTILTLTLSATACVTGTREISLEVPEASSGFSKSGAVFIAEIKDSRGFEQKPKIPETPSVSGKLETKSPSELSSLIGRQRNGYGGAMGSVALQESSVQAETRKLVEASLKARGYTIASSAEGARELNIDIQKFWAWMVPGFVSIGFESELDLTLRTNDQTVSVTGKGNNEGQIASDANWALTYKRAFQDLLDNLENGLTVIGL